jgi:hypothetical protein
MNPHEFEQEVRIIARALWPSFGTSDGAEMISGRERDLIFHSEDLSHYIEITTSQRLEKIKKDVVKLTSHRAAEGRRGKLFKLWIVTLDEPTADQRTYCREHNVEILSIAGFRQRVINGNEYLEVRARYRFGSAANPLDNSEDISNVYVQPVSLFQEGSGDPLSARDLALLLENGASVALLADYGMGKSVKLREIFLDLKTMYYRSKGSGRLPVLLNLRDHWGQSDPAEALERHATRVGFSRPEQLIRALHAGRLILLLDGFDEMATVLWSRHDPPKMRHVRAQAVSLVKKFISTMRGRGGLLVAGRDSYFDSRRELASALGLDEKAKYCFLTEFTPEEAVNYLLHEGFGSRLPDWLPRRPLFLTSLAARGVLQEALETNFESGSASAWSTLINIICRREATAHEYLDSDTIRRILERLASRVRSSSNNQGPILEQHVADAFLAETGIYPDEPARVLLQRLPGLSSRNQEDGTRVFLDDSLRDVLQAAATSKYIANIWTNPEASTWSHGLGSLGIEYASESISPTLRTFGHLRIATKEAVSRWAAPTLALDLVQVALLGPEGSDSMDYGDILISGGGMRRLDLSADVPLRNLTLGGCLIDELALPRSGFSAIRLENCAIGTVSGVLDRSALPNWVDASCHIESFDDANTNAEVLFLTQVPMSVRVLLTMLRKLFLQDGVGRKENALFRGLDDSLHGYVDQILDILADLEFAYKIRRRGETLWVPAAAQRERAKRLVMSLGHVDDPVLIRVSKLDSAR